MRKNGSTLIYFGGIAGSGKTTIGRLTSERLPELAYISSGEIKRPEARRRFEQSLSLLDQEKTFKINAWFFDILQQPLTNGVHLIDTHYTYPLPDSTFVRLLPENYAGTIDLFVLVEAMADEIVSRRIRRGRDRDFIDIDFVKRELDKEREEAHRISDQFGKPLEILDNGDQFTNSVLHLVDIISRRYHF